MQRQWARGAVAGLASGLLLVIVVACGTPQPSATPELLTAVPSATFAVSPTPTMAAVEEPKVECGQNTAAGTRTDANGSAVPLVITLTCENAVAAAKALVGPGQDIASIEFDYGYWLPPGAHTAGGATRPNTGHVIFHTNGPDLLVSVKADDAGKVTASGLRLLPSPSG